jgi:Secretion system C-terminal sorting domain
MFKKNAASCIVITAVIFFVPLLAGAEGSRELNSSTSLSAHRVFLSYAIPNTTVSPYYGFYRITTQDTLLAQSAIYVYAKLNENILVSSSALGVGVGAIKLTKPDGITVITFTAQGPGGAGFITPGTGSKARENAGPYGLFNGDVANGYTPLVVIADQEGIWRVDFISPNPNTVNGAYMNSNKWPTGNTPNNTLPLANADFEQRRDNVLISAFDVTITSSGVVQYGRLFSEYLQLSNSRASKTGAGASAFYRDNIFEMQALTRDGFRYRIRVNGMCSDGFFLYADNTGVQQADGQTPAYQSTQIFAGASPSLRIFNPFTENENAFETRHKLFFNIPDASMPATTTSKGATTWLYPTLISTGTITLSYTATGTPYPLSGNAQFNFPNIGIRYRIKFDLNRNGIFGDPGDYVLSGVTAQGMNNVYWDGRDSSGTPMSASNCYDAKLEFIAGEFHLPLADVEHFRGGIEIARLNGSGTVPNDTIYWNDIPLNDNNNINLFFLKQTPPQGVSSANGLQRRWEHQESSPFPAGYTGNPTHTGTFQYGNDRYMDQWAVDTLESKILTPFICLNVLNNKITGISVIANANKTNLSWSVYLQQNMQGYFIVEHSLNNRSFSILDTVLFSGNTNTFSYTHSFPSPGKHYYRVIVKYPGSQTMSETVMTDIKPETEILQVYPNPASSFIRIQLQEIVPSSESVVSVMSANGMVFKKMILKSAAISQISIHELPAGFYIIEVKTTANKIIHKSFIKY